MVRNGVPFDVAYSLDNDTRDAWCIIFSEFENGAEYNFETRTFERPE